MPQHMKQVGLSENLPGLYFYACEEPVTIIHLLAPDLTLILILILTLSIPTRFPIDVKPQDATVCRVHL